jgi:hypothetical protein
MLACLPLVGCTLPDVNRLHPVETVLSVARDILAMFAAAAAAGVVVMFAGAVLMHELLLQPLAAWLVPLVVLLGLLLLAGIVLELRKAKVWRFRGYGFGSLGSRGGDQEGRCAGAAAAGWHCAGAAQGKGAYVICNV